MNRIQLMILVGELYPIRSYSNNHISDGFIHQCPKYIEIPLSKFLQVNEPPHLWNDNPINVTIKTSIWFPELGVPPVIIRFRLGFSLINHPFWIPPWLWKSPLVDHSNLPEVGCNDSSFGCPWGLKVMACSETLREHTGFLVSAESSTERGPTPSFPIPFGSRIGSDKMSMYKYCSTFTTRIRSVCLIYVCVCMCIYVYTYVYMCIYIYMYK